MNKNVTLISYTPGESGWIDRCGDFVRGKDSELNFEYFSEAEKEKISERMAREKMIDSDVEFTILINGLGDGVFSSYKETGLISIDEEIEYEKLHEEIYDVFYEKLQNLKKEKEQKDLEEKLKKEKEVELKKKAEQEKKESAEKAELSRLLAKYGK